MVVVCGTVFLALVAVVLWAVYLGSRADLEYMDAGKDFEDWHDAERNGNGDAKKKG